MGEERENAVVEDSVEEEGGFVDEMEAAAARVKVAVARG